MQVLSENSGLLTNLEVLDLIKERRVERDMWKRPNTIELQPRIALEYKLQEYAKSCACSKLSTEQASDLIRKINAMQLKISEEELIQLVNLLPTTEVEMYLVS